MKKIYFALIFVSIFIIPFFLHAQESVIGPELEIYLKNVADSDLVPVLVFFKDKLILSDAEKNTMKNMTLNERQNYFVKALRKFTERQEEMTLKIIKEAENKGKAKLLFNLWAAYGISCLVNKNVIYEIAAVPDVRKIYLDPTDTQSSEVSDIIIQKSTGISRIASADITWPIETISAPEVWDMGITGQGVTVAVLDDGFDDSPEFHPDLSGQLWNGRDANGRAAASGVYLYKLSTNEGFAQTRKLLLIK